MCIIEQVRASTSFRKDLLLVVLLITVAYFGMLYDSQFVRFFVISVITIFGIILVMSIKKSGAFPSIIILLGAGTLVMISLIGLNEHLTVDNVKFHIFWWDSLPQKLAALENMPSWGKNFALFSGTGCLFLGILLAYKPEWVYVKNRLSFEYPYPIWQSKNQEIPNPNANLIPLKKLLSQNEKIILSKYRYVLVLIENKYYLVSKNESVPEDTVIIRSKPGNSLCGL